MERYDIGFLGGGQLARMSIQAAQRMGLECASLDPGQNTPASQLADALVAPFDQVEALTNLLRQCAVVTFENEFAPVAPLRAAAAEADFDLERFLPHPDVLETVQDKLLQRRRYLSAGLPSPLAVPLSEAERVGFPLVAKSRFGGYDGKGVRMIEDAAALAALRAEVDESRWLAETRVPFARELAVMVALSEGGATAYPVMTVENRDAVCDVTFPNEDGATLGRATEVAVEAAAEIAEGSDGLFGVELFQTPDGEVWVNEIAPRPHNTGHYTLDWGELSQFDAHVRLAVGLGMPESLAGLPVAMANLLAPEEALDWRSGLAEALLEDPDLRVHWYGKEVAKPGRKMGHLNLVAFDGNVEETATRVRRGREAFLRGWTGSDE